MFCLPLFVPALPATAADTLRCGSRLVSTGELADMVAQVCGEPDFIDDWTYTRAYGPPVTATTEWYYDFGPSQLLRILRFDNDRLAEIDSDGYGFGRAPDGHCRPSDIDVGMSKFRLLLICGQPDSQQAYNILAPLRRRDRYGSFTFEHSYPGYVEPVYREDWVYNFGPRYLLREVRLENGRVVEVDNGERGY